jgi:hypothetical protein
MDTDADRRFNNMTFQFSLHKLNRSLSSLYCCENKIKYDYQNSRVVFVTQRKVISRVTEIFEESIQLYIRHVTVTSYRFEAALQYKL